MYHEKIMNNTIGTVKELTLPQVLAPRLQSPPVTHSEFEDDVQTLPTDGSPMSDNDKKIIKTFFTSPQSSKIIGDFKEAIASGIVFFILSLPQVDEIISKFTAHKSQYILIGLKMCIFIVILYLFKNISLHKKTN